MGKSITVGEGHTTGIKTDHRNGKQTEVENKFEVRPVIEGYHNETVRDKYQFKRPFITIFQEDLYHLVTQGEMSLREWRVFMYLCATLNAQNITVTFLDQIAEELGMQRENVSRTLTKLKKRNLIIEKPWIASQHGPGARAKVYTLPFVQLNCNIVYNGQIKNYDKVRNHHPQLTTINGETLLNPHAEAQRQQLLREQRERETLFPDYFADAEFPGTPEFFDPETGEVME